MRTLKLLVLVPFAIAAVAAACGGGKKEPVTPSTDTTPAEGGADASDIAPSTDTAVDSGSAAAAVVDSGPAPDMTAAPDAGTDAGKKKKGKKGK